MAIFRVRQKRASEQASELVRDDSESRGTFLGLVQFPKIVRQQFSRGRSSCGKSVHTPQAHPRYPRHFRSTKKKKKPLCSCASTLPTKRILTSAVSFSLSLFLCRSSLHPLVDTRFWKRSFYRRAAYFRHMLFHFLRLRDLAENILALMKLFSRVEIYKLSLTKTISSF